MKIYGNISLRSKIIVIDVGKITQYTRCLLEAPIKKKKILEEIIFRTISHVYYYFLQYLVYLNEGYALIKEIQPINNVVCQFSKI